MVTLEHGEEEAANVERTRPSTPPSLLVPPQSPSPPAPAPPAGLDSLVMSTTVGGSMGGSLSGDVVDHHGHTDNDTHTEDEDDDDMCPICLIPLTRASRGKFCVGPCGHCICQADAERILLSTTKHAPPVLSYYYGGGQGGDESIDPYLYVPTLGRCPICRHGWSLFDLQHVNDKDDNSEAATTDNNEDGRDGRTTTTPPRRLVYVKNTDMTLWPVTGKTFADERRGGNGLALSFDLDQGPVVSWYKEPDNGLGVAEEGTGHQQEQVVVVHFEPGSHFHDRSRTFHGHVVLRDDDQSATWGGVSLLRCILQFSSDYRFIPLGVWMDDEDKVIQWLGVGRRMLHSVGLSFRTRTCTTTAPGSSHIPWFHSVGQHILSKLKGGSCIVSLPYHRRGLQFPTNILFIINGHHWTMVRLCQIVSSSETHPTMPTSVSFEERFVGNKTMAPHGKDFERGCIK
jgi:hypothetical protein